MTRRPGGTGSARDEPRRDGRAAQPRGGAARPRSANQRAGSTSERGRRDAVGRAAGGSPAGAVERGAQRLAPRTPRRPEPVIADGITGKELDRSIWMQLRTLSKENAEGVAQHLVMAAALLEEDVEAAQAHAETAVRRAGRVPAAREALGLVAYRKGDWARALGEFRTVRRLSGSSHLLPLMVDCERGLGRLERALELAASPEARTLGRDERVELAIVVSGIRRDLGQFQAARAGLEIPELMARGSGTWSARLGYAYAEALLAAGDVDGAREWFSNAVDADVDALTDAAERLEELDGVRQLDLLAGGEEDAPSHGQMGR